MGSPQALYRKLLIGFIALTDDKYKVEDIKKLNISKLQDILKKLIKEYPHDELCFNAGICVDQFFNNIETNDELNAGISAVNLLELELEIRKKN